MRLLSTKILDFSFKQRLLGLGFSLIEFPFIQVEELSHITTAISGEALIFTSQNAVGIAAQNNALRAEIQKLPCFCVGSKTQSLLEHLGAQVIGVAPTAEALKAQLSSSVKSYTFFCGKRRLNTIELALKRQNIPCQIIEVYQTVLTPYTIQKPVDGLLFFSPSAVESYFSLPQKTKGPAFCLGPSTLNAYQNFETNGFLAKEPNASGMLVSIQKYFKDL